MGEDLRKYAPRISTIMRETDPRKMEEQHRKALEDPALLEAVAQLKDGIGSRPTPVVPMPAISADEERPVTKPAAAPVARALAGRAELQRRALVVLAAVAAVLIPTALGITFASRRAPGSVTAAIPSVTGAITTASPSASLPAVPSATPIAVPSATTTATAGPSASPPPAPAKSATMGKAREPSDTRAAPPSKRGTGATALPPEPF